MEKRKTIIIDEFDGGVTRDLRVQSTNKFKISKNFDNYSDRKRLIPLNTLISTQENKTYNIVKFLSTNSLIYGLGITVDTSIAKIYKKSPTAGDWSADRDVAGLGARNETVFFEYKDYLYFWEAGARLTRHGDITGSATNATYQTIAYTDVAQPVHHPADDIAYFFSDNKVHTLNVASWSLAVLTLPDNLIITCACAYGDYLAIGCKPKSGSGSSIVFLWDRDSSLTTISEKIDWGKGDIMVLDVLDGILIGISNVSTSSTFSLKPKVHIKGYAGSLNFLQELDLDSTTTGDEDYRVPAGAWGIVQNSKLYFPIVNFSGTDDDYTGIWVVGRHELGSPFSVTLAYKTTTAASNPIQGFNIFEDYVWIAHSDDGSVDRTSGGTSYATASYESQIFTGQDSSKTKKLLSATVMTEPQPSAGQTLLYYKRDAETTWTLIFTNTTDDDIRHTAINIESGGVNLGLFKEVQFKIESKGGTVITGLKFKYEEIDDDLIKND